MKTADRLALVADIGGTNSRFASFAISVPEACANYGIESHKIELIGGSVWFDTKSVSSFSELLSSVKNILPFSFSEYSVIVFAVPGFVTNSVYCKPPNIDWDIDLNKFRATYRTVNSVLINDFVAHAFAGHTESEKNSFVVNRGIPVETANIATLGPGTGFGKVAVVNDGRGIRVVNASEGGHATVTAENQEEFEFCKFLYSELGFFPVWDNILSGFGLSRLHRFLFGENLSAELVTSRFPDCPQTLDWFSTFLGRAARNFVLDTLALGGVFFVGGILAQNPCILSNYKFMLEFSNSHKYKELLLNVPIKLILDRDSGIHGASVYALNYLLSNKNHLHKINTTCTH